MFYSFVTILWPNPLVTGTGSLSKAFSCRAAGVNEMSKRILVVEDQPDNRQIIRDMLAPADYEITEAENGEQALAAIAKQRPDLILMDIQLPIMDGYTATRRIKADPALRSIPIIAVTSYVLSGEEKKAGRRAAMTMCRNPLARANCCRKFAITCNSGWHDCCGALGPDLALSGRRGALN
jgi:two-component system, cell cycle response regulator DivK